MLHDLTQLINEAILLSNKHSCKRDGHVWVPIGGTACMDCGKSQMVHECKYCEDCDYGHPDIAPDCALGKCTEH